MPGFSMLIEIAAALGIALLFIGGALLIGVGLIVYARALNEIQVYRSNRLANDVQQETLRASEDAVDEIAQGRARNRTMPDIPTDDELQAFTRADTILSRNGEAPDFDEALADYTTTDNNDMQRPGQDDAAIPADRVYVRGESVL